MSASSIAPQSPISWSTRAECSPLASVALHRSKKSSNRACRPAAGRHVSGHASSRRWRQFRLVIRSDVMMTCASSRATASSDCHSGARLHRGDRVASPSGHEPCWMFFANRWRSAADWRAIASVDPAEGETGTPFALATAGDVDEAVKAAQGARPSGEHVTPLVAVRAVRRLQGKRLRSRSRDGFDSR